MVAAHEKLIREAEVDLIEAIIDYTYDYYQGKPNLADVHKAIDAYREAILESLPWEYVPGFLYANGAPFPMKGVIEPSYVQKYIDEGGEVLRRRAVSYEEYRGVRHNHTTRDIKPRGECPSCDRYHEQAGDREE